MFNKKTYYHYINCLKYIVYISYFIIPIINIFISNSILDIMINDTFLIIIKNLIISIIECFILTLVIGIIIENMKMKLEIYTKIIKIEKYKEKKSEVF